MKYVGHHGSKKDIAKRIIKVGFSIDYRSCGWLGTGVYFFEDDPYLAKEWAQFKFPNTQTEVIESVIEVEDNRVFDLRLRENRSDFHKARSAMKERIKKMLKEKKKKMDLEKQVEDGKVFDYFCKRREILLVILDTYTPNIEDREDELRWSRVANGTELCVKNVSIIKERNIKEMGD